MAKAKKTAKPKETATIHYKSPFGDGTATVQLPLGPGQAERLLNDLEAFGCNNIADVRKQLAKLY